MEFTAYVQATRDHSRVLSAHQRDPVRPLAQCRALPRHRAPPGVDEPRDFAWLDFTNGQAYLCFIMSSFLIPTRSPGRYYVVPDRGEPAKWDDRAAAEIAAQPHWDDRSALTRLEQARWGDTPTCPLCGDPNVARKREPLRCDRWRCHACGSSFTVLSGTIMARTKAPLALWLYVAEAQARHERINLAALARTTATPYRTVWSIQAKVRTCNTTTQDAARALTERSAS